MSKYTVVYGKNDLVGVYRDGGLIATHDKHTKGNGDLERFLGRLEKDGHKVEEQKADFDKFQDVPAELSTKKASASKDEKPKPSAAADGNPDHRSDPEMQAGPASVKAVGEVKPKSDE